jgi:hypothetical protein
MMYKSIVFILLVFAVSAYGQSPAKIFKQAEKALGGSKAIQSINSAVMRGRITRVADGASGSFRSESGKPNLFHVEYDIAGDETEIGYNGRSAWRRDPQSGLQTLTGSESLAIQALAVLRNSLWLNIKTDKTKAVYGGTAQVNGQTANVVSLTTQKGVTTKIYFDAATSLPAKAELGEQAWEFDDYRQTGTVKMPYLIRLVSGGQNYAIAIDEISPNATIARSIYDFPNVSGQPLPDLAKLFEELKANQERIEELLESYAYTRKVTTRELTKDGVLKDKGSETQQISFYKGYPIERTIERDGKPLTPSQQADEDKDAAKRTEEIDKLIARGDKSGNGQPDENTRKISLSELLKASSLKNARRERFRGRDVVVFDFEPNPAFDMKNAKSMLKFFGKTAGVIWVDEKDKQLVRVEAYLADDFSVGGGLVVKLKKGATFVAEQDRINDEIWLPSLMEINLSARVFLLKGIAVNQLIRSYDYRKFQTEVKDAKVNEVQKP